MSGFSSAVRQDPATTGPNGQASRAREPEVAARGDDAVDPSLSAAVSINDHEAIVGLIDEQAGRVDVLNRLRRLAV